MATRSTIIIDPVRNVVIASGSGAPPSDFLPGEGSIYTDYTTGAGYTLGSSGWGALAAGGSYLALSGGTLTGALIGTTGSFSTSLSAPLLNGIGSSSTSIVHQAYVTGDGFARGYRRADGLIAWGPGSAAADTNLYRAAAAALKTDGAFFVGGVLYAGAAATSRSTGDINARRSSTTGAYYFGDGTNSYLYFDGSNYFFGANGSTADLEVSGRIMGSSCGMGIAGQGRFLGWYTSGDLTGFGCEIGVSSGTAFVVAYNRSTSAFGALGLEGSTIDISPQNGSNPTCNSKILASITIGTTIPGTTPVDGDLFALTS